MPGAGPPIPPVPKPDDVVAQKISRITNTATVVTGGRQMAQDSTGLIWRVWAEESDGGTYRVRASYGVSNLPDEEDRWLYCFTETVASGSFEPQALCICVDENDEPMVLAVIVFLGAYYAYPYHRASGTWTVRTAQSLGYKVEWVSMECDSAGKFAVMYPVWTAGGLHNIDVRTSTDDLVTWGVAQPLATNTANDNGTAGYIGTEARGAIAFDRDGTMHAVFCYVSSSTGSWDVRYRYKVSGGTWSTVEWIEQVLTPGQYHVSRSQRMVSLAIDGDDVPHVVFVRGNATGYQDNSSVFYSSRVGGSWSALEAVTDEVPHDWEYPALSLEAQPDVDQVMHVAVCGIASLDTTRTDKVAYHIEHDGTSWGGPSIFYTPESGTSATNGQALHMVGPNGRGVMNTGYVIGFTAGAYSHVGWPIDAEYKNESNVRETLTLSEQVVGQKDAIRISITEELALTESRVPSGEWSRSAHDALALSETVKTNMLPKETLTLSEVASTAGSEWNRSASETLTLAEGVSVTIPTRCETSYTPTPPILASWSARTYTILMGPYDAPTVTVYLPRPNFSDVRELEARVVTQRNLAGQPLQFAKDNTVHRLRLSWRGLSRRKIQELDNFFDTVKGYSIRYTDHEAIVWRVMITSSPVPLEYGDAKDYDNEMRLELEGNEVEA